MATPLRIYQYSSLFKAWLFLQDDLHLEERAIEPIFEECVAVMEVIARERRVTVRIESAGSKPVVILDAMRMKQVFINLILNAVQASPEGETVTVPRRGRP